jgi:AraC-like DNA-binding protein
VHAHHAIQVCIGLSGGVRLRTGPRARWEEYDGAIVPSDQPHVSDYVPGVSIATLWLDPHGADGRRFAGAKEDRAPIMRVARSKLGDVVPRLLDCWHDARDPRRAAAIADRIVELVLPPGPSRPHGDSRVTLARELLAAAPERRTSLGHIAASVSLSRSRLAHLFSAEVGLPMRRYLLWLRLRDAIVALAQGASITAAAHAAGFADAPHFSRTFRRMLGFTPSEALQVSTFVHDAPADTG